MTGDDEGWGMTAAEAEEKHASKECCEKRGRVGESLTEVLDAAYPPCSDPFQDSERIQVATGLLAYTIITGAGRLASSGKLKHLTLTCMLGLSRRIDDWIDRYAKPTEATGG